MLTTAVTDADRLLTVPGHAMSRAQREEVMALPAFSDESDPLFGPAVWKYRDANARAAERAVATGEIDAFGRPARPVFVKTDGASADAEGRPMAEALIGMARKLDRVASKVGPKAAVAAVQGAVNDLGDTQVHAQTPKDAKQANRLLPRLVIDGALGPKTGQALRLALHHAGQDRLNEALSARLGSTRLDRAPG